jgi:hypothetical protein
MGRHSVVGLSLLLLAAACGDEDETSGTVEQTPPDEVAPAAGEAAAQNAPAAEAPAAAEMGPVVNDDAFELRAAATGPYQQGQLGQFAITLTPRGEWHVNEEYPISVELEAPAEVGLPRPELERSDAAEFGEERARFDVPFTPTAAGQHRVQAKVSFAVCTPENCIPDERTLALVLPVQ